MAEKPARITLFDVRQSWWRRLVDKLVFFALLALCIWLSIGSTWWTLVTTVLFLLAVKLMVVNDPRNHTFASLDDLDAWVKREQSADASKEAH